MQIYKQIFNYQNIFVYFLFFLYREVDLNHRPRGYESRATNQLSYLGIVPPQGLEPWTRWLRVSYSNQLSYESVFI